MGMRFLALLLFSFAVATGAGAPSSAAEPEAQPVTIAMKEYVFLPAQLTFKVGVPYHLHFVNEGKELHEFTASAFFKSVDAKNPQILANGGQEVVLQPGEAKDFDFTPKKAGHFPVTCADHDWAGMTGGITVE